MIVTAPAWTLGHHDLGSERHPVGVVAAPGARGDAALEHRHAGREQQGDAGRGEQDAGRGHLGVVEDLPDPEEEPFLGLVASYGVAGGHREPQEQRPE